MSFKYIATPTTSLWGYWDIDDGSITCPSCSRSFREPDDNSVVIFVCPHCDHAWVARSTDLNMR